MKKVLVTGADGFIGSHLAEYMVQQGYDVRAFVQYNSFSSWGWLDQSPLAKDMEIFAGNVIDPFGVKKAMEGCDGVLHLAALIAIPYSYHSPQSYVETNVTGTLNIVQAARELGIQRVIHTSTSEVYGTAISVPITEEHPLQGQSPYSATKIGADQIALSYYRAFETPVAVIRPFNTYGPRQSARAVIPTVITQVANGKTDIQLGALTPTRDFNFVSDTVRGFEKALVADGIDGEVINLASEFEVSIEETAQLIGKAMGKELNITQDPERIRPEKSEVERLFGCGQKAKKLLGWQPEYGGREGFVKGLALTAEWFQDAENLRAYKADRYNI